MPSKNPQLGKYRHYKGKDYQVIGVAIHTETDEELVVYKKLYDDYGLRVRPLAMFMEEVEVGGQKVPRFKLYKKGFTLIELLVVVAIIGVLASVVMVALNTSRAKARDSHRTQDLKSIQLAMELYYDDHGFYPIITVNPGILGPSWQGGSALSSVQPGWDDLTATLGPYIRLPSPSGGNPYIYQSTGTATVCVSNGTVSFKVYPNGYYLYSFFENLSDPLTANDGGVLPTGYEVFGGRTESYPNGSCS
ncbi:MAG: DUF1653 domain-containing protein [Patescibacteria group bacterium]